MRDVLDQISTGLERAFSLCSRVSLEMGCVDESLLAAKRALSYNPSSAQMLELFPQFEPAMTKIKNLVDSYGRQLQTDSGNLHRWTVLGLCYLALGDFPNAFAAYGHAIRMHYQSDDPFFWYGVGVVYAHSKAIGVALGCNQKVLEVAPHFIYIKDVVFRIGLLSRVQGNYVDALEFLGRAEKAPPNGLLSADILLQIAYTHQLIGSDDTARSIYSGLHEHFPRSLQGTIQYAWFLFLKSKSEETLLAASKIVDQGLAFHGQDPTLRLVAGRIAMRRGDVTKAYDHYRHGIRYCNDNPYLWCALGVLYYKNDQQNDAVTAFHRALYVDSGMSEAWLNIGLICEQIHEPANAQKTYQTGQSTCPNVQEFADRLAALAGHPRPGVKPGNYPLLDVDDVKLIRQPPERFAMDYIAAVPELPPEPLGIVGDFEGLNNLATFPKSYFA